MIYEILSIWCVACKRSVTMNPILISQSNCMISPKSSLRRIALLAGASLILIAGASTSCSTARGFGQDVEKTGDKIQEAASH